MIEETNANDIDLIVSKVLSKEASPDEILIFSRWLNEDERNKREFSILSKYSHATIMSEGVMSDIAFEKYIERIKFNGRKKSKRTFLFLSIASSIAILIGFLSIQSFLHIQKPIEYYTYLCKNGIHQITLADGTLVYLNKNSKLTYSNEYGKEKRHVQLEGEAYFDVSKSDRLFIVDLGEAQIEVLGTKFNVHSYADDPQTVTTLIEGSICFKAGKQEIFLKPNDQLVYTKANSGFKVFSVDAIYSTAWKDGIYKYSSIHFEELCAALEKMYSVEIKLSPRLGKVTISGSFEPEKMSVDEVLEMVRKSLSFKYTMKEDIITIN